MRKITTLTDIWKAKNIPRYIADSMEQRMLKLCRGLPDTGHISVRGVLLHRGC